MGFQTALPAYIFDLHDADAKQRLLNHLDYFRAAGTPVTLAPGCFDLLGVHHMKLLYDAAQQPGKLFVGVNCDAVVRRLKGQDRPVYDAWTRAHMVSFVRGVDGVVIFYEDTPRALIEFVRPACLVKGAIPGQVTEGAELVPKVIHVPIFVNSGTTLTIRRIRQWPPSLPLPTPT